MTLDEVIENLERYKFMLLIDPITEKVLTKMTSDNENFKDYLSYEIAINAIKRLQESKWIPCEQKLPTERGRYLCTVEWYGCSDKETLQYYGDDIPLRVITVHYNDTTKSFEENDEFNNYKVIAWKPLPEPYDDDLEGDVDYND